MTIKKNYGGLFLSKIAQIEHYSNNVRHYSRKLKKQLKEDDLVNLCWNVYRQGVAVLNMIPDFIDDVENPKNKEWLQIVFEQYKKELLRRINE